MARASIILPTHDHDETLPMAVRSVLAQTEPDLEVLIVGDGVDDRVRRAALDLCSSDRRVRFFDLPKGPHHGEIHRDRAVRDASSNAIFYLCDDDLLLPRHVENLLPLLEAHDLVQCRNGYVDTEGELVLFPTDLALPEAIAWHLKEPRRNAVSLTGTAHRRDVYLELEAGWTTTPEGQWPDHFMWKKLLVRPGVRAATHPEMTAIQLPTSAGRELVPQSERSAELSWWAQRLAEPDAHDWVQLLVARVTPRQLDSTYRWAIDATHDVEAASDELQAARGRLRVVEDELRLTSERLHLAEETLRAVETSRSWRWTAPVRNARARLRRTEPG